MRKTGLMLTMAAIYGATAASATPIAPVETDAVANVHQAGWLCGPYRVCWWQADCSGWYGFGYYGSGYCHNPRPGYSRRYHRHRRYG